MTASLETFAKVRALHDRTTNPGEKAAAAGRMEALARSAGMTVAEALSKLDAPAAHPQPRSFFEDLFNTPEHKAWEAKRERERASRRSELLKVYGSEAAVFADTPREAAMRAACAPLITRRPITGGEMDTLDGWSGVFDGRSKLPDSVREAVSGAWPLPRTVAEAWAEFDAAERLDSDRCVFAYEYSPEHWVEARRYVLEELLDTLPARSLNDLRARLSWFDYHNAREIHPDPAEERVRLATLRADIERMGARIRESGTDGVPVSAGSGAVQSGRGDIRHETSNVGHAHISRSPDPAPSPVQSGQPVDLPDAGNQKGSVDRTHPLRRTNAEKRRAVLDLLRVNAGNPGNNFSDREIARRAGVSPQTVGNIRKARS
ncbi:hypothetical protein [Methylobacterium indicum]|uniref:Uncharacterized protein n=1 Tax=Methylobacterium indicum TaxID=1775910 RepID=A0A8H8X1S7_9HYPH|nr:hypothetical protein [Methylobacterium indicum]BCM88104.1 hypothetical protein mvi_65650 [Methylobacterium indicum]